MFAIVDVLYRNLKDFDDKYKDQRTKDWFLMSNPWHVVALVGIYYTFVMYCGPKFMKTRKAFELKTVLLIYNALQVVANFYLATAIVYGLFVEKPFDNYGCMLPKWDYSNSGKLEIRYGYSYLVLKFIDYLDTVFFVLRKRQKQVNFLHVYHHIMISLGTFVYMRYQPGGQCVALAILNSYVHAVMYFYYLISALREDVKSSLWWKKYITQIQLLQFTMLTLHFMRPLLDSNCPYPKVASIFAVAQNVIMTVLFSKFYYTAYVRKPKSKELKTN